MTGPRTAARGLRAVVALLVLLTLCVGIPLLLLALAPTSFPHGAPGPGDLLRGLTERDDGTLFLAVLTLAAWLGWATFAVAVLLEVPAQLRGVPALRVPGLGVQQSLASGLVTAVLAIVLVPGAASAAVRAPAPGEAARPVAAASVHGARPDATRPAPTTTRALPAAAGPVHVVHAGDTLWDLAAQHLGDGSQWRRIAALNYERAQPDGSTLDRTHVLHPGWRLGRVP